MLSGVRQQLPQVANILAIASSAHFLTQKGEMVNIFVTDEDPVKSAQTLCDKHVVKMVLESAQMLSTAWRQWDPESSEERGLYKSAHPNHPCTKWVSEAQENYEWLYEHFKALCEEYTHRYDKQHASSRLLNSLSIVPDFPEKARTTFKLAMPPQYKEDAVGERPAIYAYRDYLVHEKRSFARWERDPSRKPDWWIS